MLAFDNLNTDLGYIFHDVLAERLVDLHRASLVRSLVAAVLVFECFEDEVVHLDPDRAAPVVLILAVQRMRPA